MSSSKDEEIQLSVPRDPPVQRVIGPEEQTLKGDKQKTAAASGARLRHALDSTMSYCASLKSDLLGLRGWSRLLAIGLPSGLLVTGIIVLAVVLATEKGTTPSTPTHINSTPYWSHSDSTTSSSHSINTEKSTKPDADNGFERGPLVEVEGTSWAEVEALLNSSSDLLEARGVAGVFVPRLADFSADAAERCRVINHKLNALSVRIIADVNSFVEITHDWFNKSQHKVEGYEHYFVWLVSPQGIPPNTWADKWEWSDQRNSYYLRQHGANTAVLNLANGAVQVAVLRWLSNFTVECNVTAVRLTDVRHMWLENVVNDTSPENSTGGRLKKVLEDWKANLTHVELFTVDDWLEDVRELRDVVQLPRANFTALTKYPENVQKLKNLTGLHSSALQFLEPPELWVEEAWLLGLLSPFVPIFKWSQFAVPEDIGRAEVWKTALDLRQELQENDYQFNIELLDRYKIAFTREPEDNKGDRGYVVIATSIVAGAKLNLTAMMPGHVEKTLQVNITSHNYKGSDAHSMNVSSSAVNIQDRSVRVLSFSTK